MKTILVTGASGFIGQNLINFLKEKNFIVKSLSLSEKQDENSYHWNPAEGKIDENALINTDIIINLAGANIAGKRWTIQRKKEIYDSRITSLNLLLKKCSEIEHYPEKIISSSAIGYYGFSNDNKVFTENSEPGSDFLSEVCVNWEKTADKFKDFDSKVVKLRIAAVLGKNGGALQKMLPIFKTGLGSAIGTGKQIFPFIYLKDLLEVFYFFIQNENLSGSFNTVSPQILTNYEFSKKLAANLQRPFFMPNVPAFVLKLMFGEMSDMLLNGNVVSSEKLQKAGFKFKFDNVDSILEDIFKKN